MSQSTSQAQQNAPASPIIPGFWVKQGQAIQARLQVAFPATLFHFKVLPPRITAQSWGKLTNGNQPFIGLGFNGFRVKSHAGGKLVGETSWTVLTAVRRDGRVDSRYYGDGFGIGALTMAEVATAVLNNAAAATGKIEIASVANVAADDWGDDAVIIKIDLAVPVTMSLADEILAPAGLGWFDVMASTWGWSAQDGTKASYDSEWNNPNAKPSDSQSA